MSSGILREKNQKLGVVKFDCLTSFDRDRYAEYGTPVQVGFAGKFCPGSLLHQQR